MRFHSVGGLLHLEERALFARVPTEGAVTEEDVTRAFGRLAMEALDSRVGTAGATQTAVPHKAHFGPLRDAIATLVGAGAAVEVVVVLDKVHAGVAWEAERNVWTACAVGAWGDACLADGQAARGKRRRDADASVEEEMEGYALRVTGLVPPLRLVAGDALDWHAVVRTPALCVHVALETVHGAPATFGATLYRGGVRWQDESDVPAEVEGGRRLHVHVCGAADGGYAFPDGVDWTGAQALAVALLRPAGARDWSRSAIARDLARAARPWAAELREMWRVDPDADALMLAVADHEVCPELSALLDASHVLLAAAARAGARLTLLAFEVLRRALPEGHQEADARAAAVRAHGVSDVLLLPVGAARLAELHALGALESGGGSDAEWCAHGALVRARGGAHRRLALPRDADAAHVTTAVAALLDVDVPLDAAPPAALSFAYAVTHVEGAPRCAPCEEVVPYLCRLGPHGVLLHRDTGGAAATRCTDGAIALDALELDALALELRRTRRDSVRRAFPALARRLELQHHSATACVREAQARRLVAAWSLEALDVGGNLSSLGLAILLALTLGAWAGARVRVYVGQTRSALLGVWHAATYVLVDPTRTVLNAFDVAPALAQLPEGGYDVRVRRGLLVEVRVRKTWHVAQVVAVPPDTRCVVVRFLVSRSCLTLRLASPCWRRLARGNDTDVDAAVRALCNRKDVLPLPRRPHATVTHHVPLLRAAGEAASEFAAVEGGAARLMRE